MEAQKNLYRATAQVYDIQYEANPPLPDAPFYLEYAQKQCGSNGEKGEILELGCGTGRVALPLAKQGFSITGLDLSQQMLDIFQEKLANAAAVQPGLAQRVEIIHGNMTDFAIGRKFALITAPFRAFQAITNPQDIENTLVCIRQHLADDGVFIVNVFNPYADPLDESWCREEEFVGEMTDDETGMHIARYECRQRIDVANQVIYPVLSYDITYPGGDTERLVELLQMKYYYIRQLRAEVEKAGMGVLEEFSWYDKTPFGDGGREIILVCGKRQ